LGNISGGFSFLRASLCAGRPRFFVPVTLALSIIGCVCQADEPVKLAMVSHSPTSPASTNVTKVAAKPASPDTNSFSASFTHYTAKPAPNHLVDAGALSLDSVPLVAVAELTRKRRASTGLFSGQPGNGNFGFANFQAGYGQAYDCDSVLLRGNNGTAWEETRYLFFKKVVKF
jgi:hypothetical protein